jgi:hypothetical protein
MGQQKYNWFDKFIRNKEGRVVIWQPPNFPLVAWALFAFTSKIASGDLKEFTQFAGTAFLFTWAYLEITKGESKFRQLLGLAVLIGIVINFKEFH